jgi:hypothetical protein
MAAERGEPVEETGYYRIRPPLKPIPLAALAALETDGVEEAESAGVS